MQHMADQFTACWKHLLTVKKGQRVRIRQDATGKFELTVTLKQHRAAITVLRCME